MPRGLRPIDTAGRAKMKEIFDISKNAVLLGGFYYIYDKTHSYAILAISFLLTCCLIVWVNSYISIYLTTPILVDRLKLSPRFGSAIAALLALLSLIAVQISISGLVETIASAQVK